MRAFRNPGTKPKRKQERTLEIDELNLEQLISRFVECLNAQDPSIGELVRPLNRSLVATIKSIVNDYPLNQLDTLVQKHFTRDRTLGDFVTHYLNYIRCVDFGEAQESEELNGSYGKHKGVNELGRPIDHDSNFDLLLSVYNPATTIFRRLDAAFFTQPMQLLSHALVHFAITADRDRKSNKNEKTSEAARQMTATLGVACIDRSTEEPNKRRAAFSLANGLFKIYFSLNNMRLCDTVVKNTSGVMHQLETHYPKSEFVTFHYYLGRLALYQRRLRHARDSLKVAFDRCKRDSYKNRRLIFIYLLVGSLPLGILPKPILLEEFSLVSQFGQVVENLKTGNWPGVINGLDQQREWFRSKGIYLLLREKLEVICWRNFFVIMAGLKNGNRGTRLSLTNSVKAARQVFMEPTIDEDDIECMASSLIDQGYLKAYIKLGEMIVFGPTLPRISSIGDYHATPGPQVMPQAAMMSAQNSSDSGHGITNQFHLGSKKNSSMKYR